MLLLVVQGVYGFLSRETPRALQGVALSDVQYEVVQFANRDQNLQLGGMLFIPAGDGPFPTVAIEFKQMWFATCISSNNRYGIIKVELLPAPQLDLSPIKPETSYAQDDWA